MITLGSSDAPVIAGVDLHGRTPWQLWARLVGLLPGQEDTPQMAWGRRLEEAIVGAVADEVGSPAWKSVETRHSEARTWQRATPDGLAWIDGTAWLIEAKALAGHLPEEPELAWLVQCQHQLMVFPEAAGVALGVFGGLDFWCWRVAPHAELQRTLLAREEAFLRLVETETPPPVEPADNKWLAQAYPLSSTLSTVTLGLEALEWDRKRTEGKAMIKQGQALVDEGEAHLKVALEDARAAVLPDGTVYTWPATTRKGYTVADTTVRTLRRKGAKNGGD